MFNVFRLLSSRTLRRFGVLACLAALSLGAQAFQCGANHLTYVVNDASGAVAGIRCVRYTSYGKDAHGFLQYSFRWYGEGRWGSNIYRHIGTAGASFAIQNPANGVAADLFGNGETTRGSAPNLRPVIDEDGQAPSSIRMTGDWNEVWHLVANANYAPLGPVTACGPNFVTYNVRSASGAPADGVRCVLKSSLDADVWYGAGAWSANRYAHLGIGARAGRTGEADDLCPDNPTGACGHFTNLTFAALPGGLRVGGNWNEQWVVPAPNKPPQRPPAPDPCRARPWLPNCR